MSQRDSALLIHRLTAKSLGQAEVKHLYSAFRCDLDIAGLEVAVDYLVLVSRGNRFGYLLSN